MSDNDCLGSLCEGGRICFYHVSVIESLVPIPISCWLTSSRLERARIELARSTLSRVVQAISMSSQLLSRSDQQHTIVDDLYFSLYFQFDYKVNIIPLRRVARELASRTQLDTVVLTGYLIVLSPCFLIYWCRVWSVLYQFFERKQIDNDMYPLNETMWWTMPSFRS